MEEIKCSYCDGTGTILVGVDHTKITYGKHEIGKDWTKIDNAWIWFQAFNRNGGWQGMRGYVYETNNGYVAPFRGELIPVIKDTKNEYRELAPTSEGKMNKSEPSLNSPLINKLVKDVAAIDTSRDMRSEPNTELRQWLQEQEQLKKINDKDG